MNLTDLAKPFPADDIEWRIAQCGLKADGEPWAKALAYITARAIHDRLDAVCGPANWQLKYKEHLGETVCSIGIKTLSGNLDEKSEWVWKEGGADKTQIEAFKGGLSGSEKRAGVPWGIGRYLYKLTEAFAICQLCIDGNKDLRYKKDWHWAKGQSKDKTKKWQYYWQTPELPEWALPKTTTSK